MKKTIAMILAVLMFMSVFSAWAFADSQLFCRICGKRIPSDSRFCPYCGTPTSGTAPGSSGNSAGSPAQPSGTFSSAGSTTEIGAFVTLYANMVAKGKYHRIPMKDAEASSERKATFIDRAEYAIDDNPESHWAEDVRGHSRGDWIKVYLKSRSDVSMIRFRMGNAYNDVSFAEHDRPSRITVYFSDGSYARGTFPDDNDKYVLALNHPVSTEWFKVVIDDIYEGRNGTDCCISEITPYAIG